MTAAGPDGQGAALWLAIVAIGAYHGLNPAMGWPLAVANGLGERRGAAVFATVVPLGAGHFLAMATVLVPFAALALYAAWQRPIRLAAGLLVLAFGLYRLLDTRHPRFLARVRPTQLALWSFLVATAHGAGLMLLPFALGLCAAGPAATPAGGLATALAVASVHTAAMVTAGVGTAWAVYRAASLRVLNRGWLNLDRVWGASLVLAGGASVLMAL
ncbi:MAG TPA: hypothetical protein VFZ93_13560 [Albitalea sp.]